jgi:hypothetical protein
MNSLTESLSGYAIKIISLRNLSGKKLCAIFSACTKEKTLIKMPTVLVLMCNLTKNLQYFLLLTSLGSLRQPQLIVN